MAQSHADVRRLKSISMFLSVGLIVATTVLNWVAGLANSKRANLSPAVCNNLARDNMASIPLERTDLQMHRHMCRKKERNSAQVLPPLSPFSPFFPHFLMFCSISCSVRWRFVSSRIVEFPDKECRVGHKNNQQRGQHRIEEAAPSLTMDWWCNFSILGVFSCFFVFFVLFSSAFNSRVYREFSYVSFPSLFIFRMWRNKECQHKVNDYQPTGPVFFYLLAFFSL